MVMVVIRLSHSFDVFVVMLLCHVRLVHLLVYQVSLAKGHLLEMFHRRLLLAAKRRRYWGTLLHMLSLADQVKLQLALQSVLREVMVHINCTDCRSRLNCMNVVNHVLHLLVEEELEFQVALESLA